MNIFDDDFTSKNTILNLTKFCLSIDCEVKITRTTANREIPFVQLSTFKIDMLYISKKEAWKEEKGKVDQIKSTEAERIEALEMIKEYQNKAMNAIIKAEKIKKN